MSVYELLSTVPYTGNKGANMTKYRTWLLEVRN